MRSKQDVRLEQAQGVRRNGVIAGLPAARRRNTVKGEGNYNEGVF